MCTVMHQLVLPPSPPHHSPRRESISRQHPCHFWTFRDAQRGQTRTKHCPEPEIPKGQFFFVNSRHGTTYTAPTSVCHSFVVKRARGGGRNPAPRAPSPAIENRSTAVFLPKKQYFLEFSKLLFFKFSCLSRFFIHFGSQQYQLFLTLDWTRGACRSLKGTSQSRSQQKFEE